VLSGSLMSPDAPIIEIGTLRSAEGSSLHDPLTNDDGRYRGTKKTLDTMGTGDLWGDVNGWPPNAPMPIGVSSSAGQQDAPASGGRPGHLRGTSNETCLCYRTNHRWDIQRDVSTSHVSHRTPANRLGPDARQGNWMDEALYRAGRWKPPSYQGLVYEVNLTRQRDRWSAQLHSAHRVGLIFG
jgi:hypothetical protein